MKKLFTILLLLAALTTLFSCRNQKPSEGEKGTPPTPAPIVSPSPVPGNEQEKGMLLRFVVMADSRGLNEGINEGVVKKTLESIKSITPQPSFAVLPGDLVEGSKSYDEMKGQLQHFKDVLTGYYPINFFYPGFGNHEAICGLKGEEAFGEVFSEINGSFLEGYNKTAYYFDNSNMRFYMLNSDHPGESGIISDAQLNWLSQNKDPGKKRNFYFFHQPAYPTGAHVGSSLDANKLQRDKFWQAIDSSENPMAFCGHEHNYTRRHINSDFNENVDGQTFSFGKSVYQVTTGSFGAPLYKGYTDKKNVDVPPLPVYHYAVVDVYENKAYVSVYNLSGLVIDYFEQ